MSAHITLNLQLTRKSPDRPGLRGERWTIAKDEPAPLSTMLALSARYIIEFCANSTDISTDEINYEIAKAAEYLAALKIEEYVHLPTKEK